MSGELIFPEFRYCTQPERSKKGKITSAEPIKPTVIHDLESFFWVLVWLGVTRGGPATTRECLTDRPNRPEIPPEVENILSSYFEGDSKNMAKLKRQAIHNWKPAPWSNEFLGDVRCALSDWLLSLDSLIRNFYEVLVQAYMSRIAKPDTYDESLHADVLRCFDKALANLKTGEFSDEEAAEFEAQFQKEITRREKDMGKLKTALSNVQGGEWDSPRTRKTLSGGREELPTKESDLRAPPIPQSPSPEEGRRKRQKPN